MSAVIRPIGIDNADLRYGWISVLVLEVIPYHFQIFQIHGQAIGLQEVFQFTVVLDETVQRCDRLRFRIYGLQRFRNFQCRFSGFYRVNQEVLNLRQILAGQVTFQNVQHCGANRRSLIVSDEAQALFRRVGSLIELSRQVFHRDNQLSVQIHFLVYVIRRRFRENAFLCGCKSIIGQVLYQIPVDYPNAFHIWNHQHISEFVKKFSSLSGKSFPFLNI